MRVDRIIIKKVVIKIILFFLVIGIPNLFVKYDQTAIVRSNAIDTYKLIRVLEYSILSFIFILVLFASELKLKKRYLMNIRLPLFFYTYYLFISLFLLRNRIIVSFYKLLEWYIFFMIVYTVQLLIKRQFVIEDFKKLVVFISNALIMLILLVLLVKPDMILWKSDYYSFTRLGGYVIHPNALGTIISLRLLHVIFYERRKLIKILVFGTIMVLTYSRGAFFSFLVALLPWFLGRKNKIFYLTMFFAIIVLVLWNTEILDKFLLRNEGISNLLTLSERIYVFASALILAKEQHFIGGGFYGGTYPIADIMNTLLGIDYWRNVHAHNELLQALCSGGLIALFLDIYIYALALYLSVKYIRNPHERAFCIGVFIIFFLYAMTMTTISWQVLPVTAMFWLYFVALLGVKYENFNFNTVFVSGKSRRS